MTATSVWHWKNLRGPLVILLAATVAVGPLFFSGAPWEGFDFTFHFVSWYDFAHSLMRGVPYPHWASSANFGAGEPRFIFYPPLSWMVGGFLGLLLPWNVVPVVFLFLLVSATGLATRALAREALEDGPATLAGCFAIFIGYAIFNVYKRSAYAELAGGLWIPLLLLFLLRNRNPGGRFWQRAFDGSTVPLALMLAGAWLSNGPVGVMASYLLAGTAAVSAITQKSCAPLMRAITAAILGLGAICFYLVPAAMEESWATMQYAVTSQGLRLENNWLFARHIYDPFLYGHDLLLQKVSSVAVIMFVVAVNGILISWLRGTLPGERRWWVPLAVIPFVVLLLLFPISWPLWNLLPRMRFIQFPWRWLVVLEAPMAIFLASAVWVVRVRWRIVVIAACAVVFVGVTAFAKQNWFQDPSGFAPAMMESVENGQGADGYPEYRPPGVRRNRVDKNLPNACMVTDLSKGFGLGEDGIYFPDNWTHDPKSCADFQMAPFGSEGRRFTGVADRDGYLVLHLRSYPSWRAAVNGVLVTATLEHWYGLIVVPVSKGNVDVTVQWQNGGDVTAGRLLSLFFLCLLAGFYWLERKLAHVAAAAPARLAPPADAQPVG